MIQIVVREVLWSFLKNVSQKTGVAIRWIWFGRKYTFEEILTNAGAVLMGEKPGPETKYGLATPGRIIHEVGTTRMGNNPATSVLNSNCQAHDCSNLFVVDAGPFVSQADKNPTWTILALSWRTSDFIVSELKKKNI